MVVGIHTLHPLLRGLDAHASRECWGPAGVGDGNGVAEGSGPARSGTNDARLPIDAASRALACMGENAAGPEFDALVPLCAELVAELRSIRGGDKAGAVAGNGMSAPPHYEKST